MSGRNAHMIRARFHGPTGNLPPRFALSWLGGRLGTVDTLCLGHDSLALGRIAADRLAAHFNADYDVNPCRVDSFTVADGGPSEYSIHVCTVWD